MDQDFHYYGTFAAARLARWNYKDAVLIARCANYVDFFNEHRFRGYWKYTANGKEIGKCDYPRYTFQYNLTGNAVGAEGLWSAFHFLPGNYRISLGLPSNTSISQNVHENLMDTKKIRLRQEWNQKDMWRLTRPLSDLSRCIFQDTYELAKDLHEVKCILQYGPGLSEFIEKETVLRRFLMILTGIRAHVICDTWAHQDFAAIASELNTYYDIDNPKLSRISGKFGIKYTLDAQSTAWHYIVLGRLGQKYPFKNMPTHLFTGVFAGSPRGAGPLAWLGHGWMGHLPDYGFMKFQYRPYWKADHEKHERNNPAVFMDAFFDLYHFLSVIKKPSGLLLPLRKGSIPEIKAAIGEGWSNDAGKKGKNNWYPRVLSAEAWRNCIKKLNLGNQDTIPYINTYVETGDHAELKGGKKDVYWTFKAGFGGKKTAYGTFTLNIIDQKINEPSDFYLFQLAADYHFQYVKSWLLKFKKHQLRDGWSIQPGPLGKDISNLTDARVIGKFKASQR